MVSWLRRYWIEIVVLAIGLVAMNAIFIFSAFRATGTINPEGAAQLGDFVGGYVGTFLVLLSVVLLVATLRNQERAAQRANFETKYYSLIQMHRDNVAELGIQGISGRKVFVVLMREFRELLNIVKVVADRNKQEFTQRQLMHITYYCLFFGVGPNSSRMLKQSLSEFDATFVNSLEVEINQPASKERVRKDRNLTYTPFEGHQSRLGHYYRHLYQSVRYVDQQTIEIDKYEYVKTIRAQLSTHEQALLLLNSLSPMGANWWKTEFIVNYRMVQNIPRDFFNPVTEIDPSKLFDGGYFEWEETSATLLTKTKNSPHKLASRPF